MFQEVVNLGIALLNLKIIFFANFYLKLFSLPNPTKIFTKGYM